MSGRWIYIHAGAAHGPVDHARLKQLAATGKLLPTDVAWQEGTDRSQAVEALALLPAESFGSAPAPAPAATVQAPAATPAKAPDWLADIQNPERASGRPPALAAPVATVDVELIEVKEEDEPWGFKRRDLLMFGLGAIGVLFAVLGGLFMAQRSQRAREKEDAKQNRGEER